jgi:polyisoprenoid-binding protein YceI
VRQQIDPARTHISVICRSTLHPVTLRFARPTGFVERTDAGLTGECTIDMTTFSTGDRMVDWKVRGELEPDLYPQARYVAHRVEGTTTVHGTLHWRRHAVPLVARGTIELGETVSARLRCDLDMRLFGIKPPRVLLLKAEPVVQVDVVLATTRP